MKINNSLSYSIALFFGGIIFTSCGSDDSAVPLPTIGGYNAADEIAAEDLVAYWPLNGDGIEVVSNTAPDQTVATSFTEGPKGQAAAFASGYLKYPSIPALAAVTGSLTVSSWIKITNQKATPDSNSIISPIFSLTNPNDIMGNLSIYGNTHGLTTSDSIQMKAEFNIKKLDGTTLNGESMSITKLEPWMVEENEAGKNHTATPNKTGGLWTHIVVVYDAFEGSTNVRIYANGVKISNPETERLQDGGMDALLPFNQFTPTFPVIGALRSVTEGTNTETWDAALQGSIDEVRVYKKALTQSELQALYELEKAGR
ncbi:hypothetical protein J2X31_001286 [Flavobacterium arsenatis]|uniref:LamG-like jellyroll fold domain-containing protein n=1 Tax=Flavobacterium arsenatis TaxID=1484332 RepID=A0ABU1TMT5_9FLAO|nr:LamG-like jellyroll fold domain-containing protein [Flavobacterium arsenatis]MDR6967279.1 hypothetical protein [Flavobacterium arsenatis]